MLYRINPLNYIFSLYNKNFHAATKPVIYTKKMRKTNTILRIFDIFYILNNYLYFMYSGVTFLPMPSSISLSLLIVAQATVVSMFPVIVADAPDLNASSPSFVSSALPAPRRMSASGFIYLKMTLYAVYQARLYAQVPQAECLQSA